MDIRKFFFKYRSYTPIPLALLILYFSQPMFPYFYFGFAILGLGEGIRFAAVRYAGGETRTTRIGASALCKSGPYSYTRNPLYIGNMFMYTGIVLIAGAPSLLLMLVVTWAFFLVQYSLIISLEEETLEGLFGEEFRIYRDNVARLLPQWKQWINDDDRKPLSIAKTFRTEKRTLQNIAFILVLIILRTQWLNL